MVPEFVAEKKIKKKNKKEIAQIKRISIIVPSRERVARNTGRGSSVKPANGSA
jgi:hypothetical protein